MKTILLTLITSVVRSVAAARAAVLGTLLIGASTTNLHAATFSDDNWTSMGGIPGANAVPGVNDVRAAVVDGSGNLYLGDHFKITGDVLNMKASRKDIL